MEDLGRRISVNSIKFYNDIGGYIHQYQDINMLKQFYMQQSRVIAARDNINLAAKNVKGKCPKCCMNRSQNVSQYEIVPHSLRSRFLRRIKKKINRSTLTRYQLKCAKRIQEHIGNRLVIKCKICRNKSREVLNKPEKVEDIIRKVPQSLNRIEQPKITKTTSILNANKKNRKQQKKQNEKTALQISKLNKFLNTSHKVRSSNLKDFIKSVA